MTVDRSALSRFKWLFVDFGLGRIHGRQFLGGRERVDGDEFALLPFPRLAVHARVFAEAEEHCIDHNLENASRVVKK